MTLKKIVVLIGFLLLASGVLGQEPKKYVPTAEQQKDLKIAQQDFIIAQLNLQRAQDYYSSKIGALGEAGNKVKEQNNWPKDVLFNPNFTDPSQAFSESPKKDEPKKP